MKCVNFKVQRLAVTSLIIVFLYQLTLITTRSAPSDHGGMTTSMLR